MSHELPQSRPKEEPEINLIPFIDVLLVVLIFLMLSTTYSKFTELQVTCPWPTPRAARPAARDRRGGQRRWPLRGQQDRSRAAASSCWPPS